jgi:hypothetical protein
VEVVRESDDDDLHLVVGAQRLDLGVLPRHVVAAAEVLGALGAARVVRDHVGPGTSLTPSM